MLLNYPHVSGEPYVWNDGSGIEIGLAAGAAMATDRGCDWHGWHRHPGTRWHSVTMPVGEPGTPEPDPTSCIFVNAEGTRFMNEEVPEEGPAWVGGNPPFFFAQLCAGRQAMTMAPSSGSSWTRRRAPSRSSTAPWASPSRRTCTPPLTPSRGLPRAMGVPADALAQTVEAYNAIVDAGEDTEFKKSALNGRIETAPFHALRWGIQKHNTLGGLMIDPGSHVLDWNGEVIPGLYAAGESAGNMDLIGLSKPSSSVASLARILPPRRKVCPRRGEDDVGCTS